MSVNSEKTTSGITDLVVFLSETISMIDDFVFESGIDDCGDYKNIKEKIKIFKIRDIAAIGYDREKTGEGVKFIIHDMKDDFVQKNSFVLQLACFLSDMYFRLEKFVFEYGAEYICQFPMIQGTRNQINIKKIGEMFFCDEGVLRGSEDLLRGNVAFS